MIFILLITKYKKTFF